LREGNSPGQNYRFFGKILIRNGIALCKNAHWHFDNGFWTIADDYTVRVAADHFSEDSPHQQPLSDYEGTRIRSPDDPTL
jgi:putative restriction endonuclease